MIFQDPYGSLNPRMTCGEIIGEALEIHFRELSSADRRDCGRRASQAGRPRAWTWRRAIRMNSAVASASVSALRGRWRSSRASSFAMNRLAHSMSACRGRLSIYSKTCRKSLVFPTSSSRMIWRWSSTSAIMFLVMHHGKIVEAALAEDDLRKSATRIHENSSLAAVLAVGVTDFPPQMHSWLRKFLGMNWILFLLMFGLMIYGVYAIYSATWMIPDQKFWKSQIVWIMAALPVFFLRFSDRLPLDSPLAQCPVMSWAFLRWWPCCSLVRDAMEPSAG